ncbi:FAD/NAD-P-binding domain-containing protein [Amanita rubescens]|nr:FAD/NAD-P-binding domain-containing protein [Amanita rubescens]
MATLADTVGIIGAGPSGLITAHVLLQDGFDVQLLTEDRSPGGVWARHRVYPSMKINSPRGEFCFSSLSMSPEDSAKTGGRLSGKDICNYMETFAETFLKDKIKFEVEVLNIRRSPSGSWNVDIKDKHEGTITVLEYSRIVLCTGGCHSPNVPKALSPSAAEAAGFQGLVVHSRDFAPNLDNILARTNSESEPKYVVVVGGGKSAQDTSCHLANEGRNVALVFSKSDAPMANKKPLPSYIRRSRFLSVLSPHIELRTRLERFLHTTWAGSKITHFIWDRLSSSSFDVLELPNNSPLRSTHSLFWNVRTTDEGTYRPDSFFAAVNRGDIQLFPSAHVEGFGADGRSVTLSTGQSLPADVVVLATGYTSSWSRLFDPETAEKLGINRHPPRTQVKDAWDSFITLKDAPVAHPDSEQWASSIYRGIVPANNIERRDFPINGAVFSANSGYTYEVSAHWISSYFLKDTMRLPSSVEEALATGEYYAAWLRKRFPNVPMFVNESYCGALCLWDWCQHVDTLLMDMHLPSMRSGGNWFSWPFQVIEQSEIARLGEERRAQRVAISSSS